MSALDLGEKVLRLLGRETLRTLDRSQFIGQEGLHSQVLGEQLSLFDRLAQVSHHSVQVETLLQYTHPLDLLLLRVLLHQLE